MNFKMTNQSLIDSAADAMLQGQFEQMKTIANSISENKRAEILSKCTKYDCTLLYMAVMQSDLLFSEFLLEDCHLDPMVQKDNTLYSLPHLITIAAEQGELEIIKLLLESGAKLNLFDEENHISPLAAACSSNRWKVAKFLIEVGEDINKSHCLTSAISQGNVKLVQYILDCEADVNVKDVTGWSPLHECCSIGDVQLFKMLIDKGADHKAIGRGLNPIHLAGLRGHTNIISLYMEEEYCSRETVLDCVELLGVNEVIDDNVEAAVNYWNKVLDEKSLLNICPIEISLFKDIQDNFLYFSNFYHLAGDIEGTVNHSMNVLERVLGIDNSYFFSKLEQLSYKLPIENILVLENILNIINDHSEYYNFYCQIVEHLLEKYISHVRDHNLDGGIPSVLDLLLRSFGVSFEKYRTNQLSSVMYNVTEYYVRCFMHFSSFIEAFTLAQMKHFHSIMRRNYNVNEIERIPVVHRLLDIVGFTEQVKFNALELHSKIDESVNYLDCMNETPLFTALKRNSNGNDIDILLRYGALTNTRSLTGHTIRELGVAHEMYKICIESVSLQTLITSKLLNQNIIHNENMSGILNYHMAFY